jgi:hypothetical protein
VFFKSSSAEIYIFRSKGSDAEQAAKDSQLQAEIKHLSERQRR